jgi:hypothetical protein
MTLPEGEPAPRASLSTNPQHPLVSFGYILSIRL